MFSAISNTTTGKTEWKIIEETYDGNISDELAM